MRKLIITLYGILISSCLLAQVDPVGAFNRHIIANWAGQYYRVSQYRVKGTPYLLGESFRGTIDYKNGKSVTGIKVLYDLYNQRAGIDLKQDEMFEEEGGVKQFTIQLPEKFGGKKLLFKNADTYANADYKGYFNVLEEGDKLVFLKAYKIQLLPDPTNEMVKDQRIFEQYFHYYIYNNETKQLHKIKLKDKDIFKEAKYNDGIKDFMKDNEIDLSKEEDVIRLVKFYNGSK